MFINHKWAIMGHKWAMDLPVRYVENVQRGSINGKKGAPCQTKNVHFRLVGCFELEVSILQFTNSLIPFITGTAKHSWIYYWKWSSKYHQTNSPQLRPPLRSFHIGNHLWMAM